MLEWKLRCLTYVREPLRPRQKPGGVVRSPEEKTTISARIPATLNERVDALAGKLARSKSWLVTEGLRLMLAREDDRDLRTLVALDQLARGSVVPHQKLQPDWAGVKDELVWCESAEQDLQRLHAAVSSLAGPEAGQRTKSAVLAEAAKLLLQPMAGELVIAPAYANKVRQTGAGAALLRYHWATGRVTILTVDDDGMVP